MLHQIHKATKQDAKELSNLVNSAYRGESSKQGWTTEADLLDGTRTTPELMEEILQRSDTSILKYVDDNSILACVELRKSGDKLYLGMLTVSPSIQSKGLGKAMLRAAEEEAIAIGCQSIYMTVISVRKELIEWYQRQGYVDKGERKPFVLPDERWGIPKMKLEFMVLEKMVS
jgi:ribosomal protein S18 acetylase RimI-like enzyme